MTPPTALDLDPWHRDPAPAVAHGPAPDPAALADRLEAYLVATGRPIRRVGATLWVRAGAVVYPWAPPLVPAELPPGGGAPLLRTLGGQVARWSTAEPVSGPGAALWYEVVATRHVPLAAMRAKLRGKFKAGLARFEVAPLTAADAAAAFAVERQRCLEYAERHDPPPDEAAFRRRFALDQGWPDVVRWWGVRQDGRLVGFAKCYAYGTFWIGLNTTRVLRDALKQRALYALMHVVSEHHLVERGARYLSDGQRSLLHGAEFQELLQADFGFARLPLRLHRAYRWPLVPALLAAAPAALVRRVPKLAGLARLEAIHAAQRTASGQDAPAAEAA